MSIKKAYHRHNLSRPSSTELNFSFQEDSELMKNKENIESLYTSYDNNKERNKILLSNQSNIDDENSLIISKDMSPVNVITKTQSTTTGRE